MNVQIDQSIGRGEILPLQTRVCQWPHKSVEVVLQNVLPTGHHIRLFLSQGLLEAMALVQEERLEHLLLERLGVVGVLAREQVVTGQVPVVMEAMACLERVVDQLEEAMASPALEATERREHFVICSFSSGASAHL